MAEMLLKVPTMLWDDNESTGYRHIGVSLDGVNMMSVLAHKHAGAWKSTVVPMGYSYDTETVLAFVSFFQVLPNLMQFLETPEEMTAEQAQQFIDERLYTMDVH